MTTKSSPIQALKAQANKIAATLKAAERGEKIDVRFAAKIEAARANSTFKAGIVMDDKVLIIEMPWTMIGATSEAALSQYIIDQMQEARS
jgi:ABC-type hemin transport system substrate-binding protein